MPCHCLFPYDDYNNDIDDSGDNVATINVYHVLPCASSCAADLYKLILFSQYDKSNINIILREMRHGGVKCIDQIHQPITGESSIEAKL